MTKICKVTFNNEPFLVNCGDLLLDGALMSGVELPHDCRSGICGVVLPGTPCGRQGIRRHR